MSRVAQVRGAKNLTISRLFAEICRITIAKYNDSCTSNQYESARNRKMRIRTCMGHVYRKKY